jgi:hypothetical protein
MSSPPSAGLALPKPKKSKASAGSTGSSGPVFGAPAGPPIGKKRRRKALLASSNDFDRALDEGDDVDEDEWKRPEGSSHRKKRRIDEDYDEEGDEEEEEERDVDDGPGNDGEQEGEGEGEEEGDDVVEGAVGVDGVVGPGASGKKKAEKFELDDEALQKRHRNAEGERL